VFTVSMSDIFGSLGLFEVPKMTNPTFLMRYYVVAVHRDPRLTSPAQFRTI
jgi:hypothetical protein